MYEGKAEGAGGVRTRFCHMPSRRLQLSVRSRELLSPVAQAMASLIIIINLPNLPGVMLFNVTLIF